MHSIDGVTFSPLGHMGARNYPCTAAVDGGRRLLIAGGRSVPDHVGDPHPEVLDTLLYSVDEREVAIAPPLSPNRAHAACGVAKKSHGS